MSDFPKTIHASFADHFDAGVWTSNGALYKEGYHRADLSADLVRAALERAAEYLRYIGEDAAADELTDMEQDDPDAVAAIIASVVAL
jgi:hypothetical protein